MLRNLKVKRLWVDQGATKVGISYDIRRQAIVLAEFMAFVEDQFDEILARPTISGASPGSLLCYTSNLWTLPSTPVVPFYPFCLGVSLLKQNSRKEGTLLI